MNEKDRLLEQSLAIRTFPLPEVAAIAYEHVLNPCDTVRVFQSDITEWIRPVCNLDEFPYLYFTNGITEAMNYWMWSEERKIKMAKDDYQWVNGGEQGEVQYVSNPASYDGNYVDIPDHMPVVLDLAYVGSSSPRRIEIPESVEKVFFSLSKTFGLRNYRIGYCWSRYPIARLELLQKSAKYYNYHSASLGEKIINRFNTEYVFSKLRSYQLSICDDLNLTPSDTVWLATSNDQDYNKFYRNYTNRLCIADLIKERYYADTSNIL